MAEDPTQTEDPALVEDFDVVVLGTGLTECIMSGLMSVDKKKVLHIDRNDFYGGAAASLTLDQLFAKFKQGEADDSMGAKRDYNCDLIPKFVMAKGLLVKILLHTRTTHYLDFAKVGGSYVMAKGTVNKVPATAQEAMSSNLMGMFEKRRMKKLLDYAFTFDRADASTHGGKDMSTQPMQATFDEYSLDVATATFIGHSIALYTDDEYLTKPSDVTLEKMKLYAESMMQYGDSPFIYPLYGLGDLPQAFARLSAVYGGTFMLDTPFKGIVTDDDGELCGINSTVSGKDCVLKCKAIFASPDYFPDKVEKKGDIARCYCILNQPVMPDGKTPCESGQIIIPGAEAGKKNDIYVMWMGKSLQVAPDGYVYCILSTLLEGGAPDAELSAGLKLLPPRVKQFMAVDPYFEPKDDGKEENIFISNSYDATSHFETVSKDCLNLYERYSGEAITLVDNSVDQ